MSRPSNKDRILDAAELVAGELGAAHLTLDAVAARAKVTKGGLLYHFKDKDQMLSAMVERYLHRCAQKRQEIYDRMPGDSRAQLKAVITEIFEDDRQPAKLHSTLLTACAMSPELLRPAHDAGEIMMRNIRSFKKPDAALTLLLAAYGLLFTELLQCQAYTPAERKSMLDYMMREIDAMPVDGNDTMRELTEALTIGGKTGKHAA